MSDLSDLLLRCHSNSAPLSGWEIDYLRQMEEWRGAPTRRQMATLQRIADRVAPSDIARVLAERIEDVALTLKGEKPSYRHGNEIRYGARQSLSIVARGNDRGAWFDHEAGVGGDALGLVTHLRQQGPADAIDWARRYLGIGNGMPNLGIGSGEPLIKSSNCGLEAQPAPEPKKTLDFARRVWREAIPAAGTLVEAYLASRGLVLPARKVLRFHPVCRRETERLPAMIALMQEPATGEPCGVHRTFLRADGQGKAPGQAKMMLGGSGVIRLSPDSEVTTGLGLAEGIETSLSIIQAAGWSPVWAAGNAGAISAFPVLRGIEALTIFADGDEAGAKAASSCAERWREEGREVTVRAAPAGLDWNDVATGRRAA